MKPFDVVLDTNVLVAGLRSRLGASFRVLSLVGGGQFQIHVSVPLILEYEDVLSRHRRQIAVSNRGLQSVLDYHCAMGIHHEIFLLWLPCLKDQKDDLVLELAVTANCDYIVTHNTRDFDGAERFQVQIVTPYEFLKLLGEAP